MYTFLQNAESCQVVPDPIKGIVVGIDVSKGEAHYAAYLRSGKHTKVDKMKRNSQGFTKFAEFLLGLDRQGYQVWVAFEPTGPYSSCLSEWLRNLPYQVVQVNPFHVKRAKELRDNSPKKSDRKDPSVIANLVWSGCYRSLTVLEGAYAELRCCSVQWDSLRKNVGRLRNEYRSVLEAWFPELGDILKNALCKTGRSIVRKYRSPAHLGRSPLKRFQSFVKQVSRGGIDLETSEAIWTAARESVGVKSGYEARHQQLCVLLRRLELAESCQQDLRGQMEHYLQTLPSAKALLTIPWIGVVTVGGLLGECGDLSRFRSYEAFEKFIGLNLCELSSGQYEGKHHISKRGRSRARHLACQAAMMHMSKNGLFHDYAMEAKQRRGEKRCSGKILVAVARKLLRIIFAIGRDGSSFDSQRLQGVAGARARDGQVILRGTRQLAAA